MSLNLEQNEEFQLRIVPEPGQLVEVRCRQWIVADVTASELSASINNPQHLVKLSSIDEDGLGEELEVIWQIEPGAHVIERAGLPTISGVDDSNHLEAFLDAVRWGSVTNADRGFLQAPFRSGVTIENFQLDPLVRAIDMARVNLLIADDVGLGKTIEAGLVIQELLLRHRARTVLVICPASLQEKWRIEMHEKFGLEFEIVDTNYIRKLRRTRGIHANPWVSFPRLITSMDWVKSGEAMRFLRDVLPVQVKYPRKFDMLVVDEAHNVAPAGSTRYMLESQRTRLIRTISPHFQHRLFLTATPHNGYTESFTSLMELLDDQRFSRNILPDEKQLSQVMIRRLKTELKDNEGNLLYPVRKLQALTVPYTDEERNIHRILDAYCVSRDKTNKVRNVIGSKFINMLLKKRLFSSPAAFASTLEKHHNTLTYGRQADNKNPMKGRILRKAILKAEEDYADDTQFEEAQAEAVEEATKQSAPLTGDESNLLEQMRTWAQRMQHKKDSKAQAIIDWIEGNLKDGGEWNERRVIIFTEYRTTHTWLHEILTSHDYGAERIEIIQGGMTQDEREIVKAAFQANPLKAPVRILLATDAASEGIDLQNYCNALIHVEIPFNPNVMEQRNGRIDRHGQKQKEVLIWHPVDGGESSEETVGGHKDDIIRALKKLESMREDMGSVNPVIAPQMCELIEGKRKTLDTREADVRIEKAKRNIRLQGKLDERIAKLHERLQETRRDFHLTPDRILETVKTGLKLAGKPPLEPVEMEGIPSGLLFKLPALTGSWARCLEGLEDPYEQIIRPATFDHDVAKGRDDIVLIHLNHRLVQMCLRLLREEVWKHEDKKLHRVAVRYLPDNELDGIAVAVISRLVITGGNHHRLHEELTVSGGYIKEKGYSRETKVTKISGWMEKAKPCNVKNGLFDELAKLFESQKSSIQKTVDARSKERLKNLANTLGARKKQEITNITTVLDELVRSIENELKKETQPEQFSLFSEDERTQVKRDNDALKTRLGRIPDEKKLEIDAIEHRYEDFVDRTFPVAVVFFVPESMAGK